MVIDGRLARELRNPVQASGDRGVGRDGRSEIEIDLLVRGGAALEIEAVRPREEESVFVGKVERIVRVDRAEKLVLDVERARLGKPEPAKKDLLVLAIVGRTR